MSEFIRYSDDDIEQAKSIDILEVAKKLGFTPIQQGNFYTLKEHDSLKIYPQTNSYYRFSTSSGGNPINFVREFANLDFKSAIKFLIGEQNINLSQNKNQTVEKVVEERKINNDKITTEVELTKKDTMNMENVPGATVEFENTKTKEKKTATTDENGKIKIKLTYGEWIYKETIAPVGYVKAEKFGKINVTENGAEIKEILWNQPIVSNYELTKQDTITKQALPGCEVVIKNQNGEVVFKGKTDENGKIKTKLRYGKYILEETIAPKGYVKAKKTLEINVTENGAEIQQVLYNDKIQLMPKTNLSNSTLFLSTLVLISGIGICAFILKQKDREI